MKTVLAIIGFGFILIAAFFGGIAHFLIDLSHEKEIEKEK